MKYYKVLRATLVFSGVFLYSTICLASGSWSWSGNSATDGSWSRADNWVGGEVPTFGSGAAIVVNQVNPNTLTNWIGSSITVGSISFDANLDGGTFNMRTRGTSTGTARDLTFDNGASNSLVEVKSTANGTFRIGNTPSNSGEVILNSNLDVNVYSTAASFGFGTTVSGSGAVIKNGEGELFFMATSTTWSGGLIVNNGVVRGNVANSFGSGNITVNGTATMMTADNARAWANNMLLNAALTLGHDDYNGNLTLTGTVSGSGGLIKEGGIALTMSAANSFAGGTTVNKGRLNVAVGGGAGSGNVVVANGAILDLQHASAMNSAATLVLNEESELVLSFIGKQQLQGLSLDGGSTWLDLGEYNAGALSDLNTQGSYSGTGIIQVIPEPATIGLLGVGAFGVIFSRRRFK